MPTKLIKLGLTDIEISTIGLGCMGMSEAYGPTSDAENIDALAHALDLGINFLDTADCYGPYRNEELIGRFLADRHNRPVVATKFGFVLKPGSGDGPIDNSPTYIRSACEASLRRLGLEVIDLYYAHRIDPNIPIEETVGVMADLVREGKVRALGLSEVSAATLRRAAAVHPIAALQSEYSLWERSVEREILPACRELGTTFVAFAPLGRGFLTGTFGGAERLANDDYRRQLPRFLGAAATYNASLVERLAEIAREQNCTPGQLALAWLLAQEGGVVPIPGTRKVRRLDENAGAASIALSQATITTLESLFSIGAAMGARYDAAALKLVNA